MSLTLLGQVLELRARSATTAAIKALLGLAPKTARRLRDDGTAADGLDVLGGRKQAAPDEMIVSLDMQLPWPANQFLTIEEGKGVVARASPAAPAGK